MTRLLRGAYHRRKGIRLGSALVWAVLVGPTWLGPRVASAVAPEGSGVDVVMTALEVGASAEDDPQVTRAGLLALGWAARRRTTIPVLLDAAPRHLLGPKSRTSPIWIWRSHQKVLPLNPREVAAFKTFVDAGGTLWVDAPDGATQGPFASSVLRQLERIWPQTPFEPLPREHVIFKSFYLIEGPIGRHLDPTPPLGLTVNGRVAIFYTRSDVLGAIAAREDGTYMLPLTAEGPLAREMSLRMGINWLMYSLCLDYKDDQVHLPYLLRRRQ